MGGAAGAEATRLAQRPRIALVGLDPFVAGGIHGREVRVGDDDLVPEPFLCKVLAHNICCGIQSMHELDIEPTFQADMRLARKVG